MALPNSNTQQPVQDNEVLPIEIDDGTSQDLRQVHVQTVLEQFALSGAPYIQKLQMDPDRLDVSRSEIDQWIFQQSKRHMDFILRGFTGTNIPLYGLEINDIQVDDDSIRFRLEPGVAAGNINGGYVLAAPDITSGQVHDKPINETVQIYAVVLNLSYVDDDNAELQYYDINTNSDVDGLQVARATVDMVPIANVNTWWRSLSQNQMGLYLIDSSTSQYLKLYAPVKFFPIETHLDDTESEISSTEGNLYDGEHDDLVSNASIVEHVIAQGTTSANHAYQVWVATALLGEVFDADQPNVYRAIHDRVIDYANQVGSLKALHDSWETNIFDSGNYPSGTYMNAPNRIDRLESGEALPPRFIQSSYDIDLRTFSFELEIKSEAGSDYATVKSTTVKFPAISSTTVSRDELKEYADKKGVLQLAYSRQADPQDGAYLETKRSGQNDIIFFVKAQWVTINATEELVLFPSTDASDFTQNNQRANQLVEHQTSSGSWVPTIGCHREGRVMIRHGVPFTADVVGFDVSVDRVVTAGSQAYQKLGFILNGYAFTDLWDISSSVSNHDLTDLNGNMILSDQNNIVFTAYDSAKMNTACFRGTVFVTYTPNSNQMISLWEPDPVIPTTPADLFSTYSLRIFSDQLVSDGISSVSMEAFGDTLYFGRASNKPGLVLPYNTGNSQFGGAEGNANGVIVLESGDSAEWSEIVSDYTAGDYQSINMCGGEEVDEMIPPTIGATLVGLGKESGGLPIWLRADSIGTFSMNDIYPLIVRVCLTGNALSSLQAGGSIVIHVGSDYTNFYRAEFSGHNLEYGMNDLVVSLNNVTIFGSPNPNALSLIEIRPHASPNLTWMTGEFGIDGITSGVSAVDATTVNVLHEHQGELFLGTYVNGGSQIGNASIARRTAAAGSGIWQKETSVLDILSEGAMTGIGPVFEGAEAYFHVPGGDMAPGLYRPEAGEFSPYFLFVEDMSGVENGFGFIEDAAYGYNRGNTEVYENNCSGLSGSTIDVVYGGYYEDLSFSVVTSNPAPYPGLSKSFRPTSGWDWSGSAVNQLEAQMNLKGNPEWKDEFITWHIYMSQNFIDNHLEVDGAGTYSLHIWLSSGSSSYAYFKYVKATFSAGWNELLLSPANVFSTHGNDVFNIDHMIFSLVCEPGYNTGDLAFGHIGKAPRPAFNAYRVIDNGKDWIRTSRKHVSGSDLKSIKYNTAGTPSRAFLVSASTEQSPAGFSIGNPGAVDVDSNITTQENVADPNGGTRSMYTFDVEHSKRLAVNRGTSPWTEDALIGDRFYTNDSPYIVSGTEISDNSTRIAIMNNASFWSFTGNGTTQWVLRSALETHETIGFLGSLGATLYAGFNTQSATRTLVILKRGSNAIWSQVGIDSSLDNYFAANAAIEYNNKLYISVRGSSPGGAIINYSGTGDIDNTGIRTEANEYYVCMATFNSKLYAGSFGNAKMLRYNGSTWVQMTVPWSSKYKVSALAVHGGKLMVAVDGHLYSMNTSEEFTLVSSPTGTDTIEAMKSVAGKLYMMRKNATSDYISMGEYVQPASIIQIKADSLGNIEAN